MAYRFLYAMIIDCLTAVSAYLKYKETSAKIFLEKGLITYKVSILRLLLSLYFGNINYIKKGQFFLALSGLRLHAVYCYHS